MDRTTRTIRERDVHSNYVPAIERWNELKRKLDLINSQESNWALLFLWATFSNQAKINVFQTVENSEKK